VELLEIALLLFQSELGADHPRCHVAARNMARAERKALGLHLPGTMDRKMLQRKNARPLNLSPLRQRVSQKQNQHVCRSIEQPQKNPPVGDTEDKRQVQAVDGQPGRTEGFPQTSVKSLLNEESGQSRRSELSQLNLVKNKVKEGDGQFRSSEGPPQNLVKSQPTDESGQPRKSENAGYELLVNRALEPDALNLGTWLDTSAPGWIVGGRRSRPGTPDAVTVQARRRLSMVSNLPPIASPRLSESGSVKGGKEAPGRSLRAENSSGGLSSGPSAKTVLPEKSVERFKIRRFAGSSFR
jgi:hypothetical protein